MREFGWAVVGPGKIAQRFADAVKQLPDTRLVAVMVATPVVPKRLPGTGPSRQPGGFRLRGSRDDAREQRSTESTSPRRTPSTPKRPSLPAGGQAGALREAAGGQRRARGRTGRPSSSAAYS